MNTPFTSYITLGTSVRLSFFRGGGAGGGGRGDKHPPPQCMHWGGLAPPMTDSIYQSETRWQKILRYSSEMAIATIYTHSKLAQLTAAVTPI